MRLSVTNILILIMILTMVAGCSGSTDSPLNTPINQTAPSQDTSGDDRSGTDGSNPDDSVGLTDNEDNPMTEAGSQGPHAVWGLYEISVVPGSDELVIAPLRTAEMHLNAIKFLEPDGAYAGVQLASPLSWNPAKTILDLDLKIVHPFGTLPQTAGFDLKGIIITNGTKSGFSDPGIVVPDINEVRLLNADGWTRWWNPEEFPGDTIFSYNDGALGMKDVVIDFKSTFNGFKYFCDSLGADDEVSAIDQVDRGVFRAGAENIRHYTLGLPGGISTLRFNYAIDASWVPPAVKPPDNVPGDFPPEANQPEPYLIDVSISGNTLYYEGPTSSGGSLSLDIMVYDWQSPLPTTALGTVEHVVVEWPGLFAPTEATFVSDEGTHAVYTATVTPTFGGLTSADPIEFTVWAESQDGDGYGGILDPSVLLVSMTRASATVSSVVPNVPPQVTSGIYGEESPGLIVETYTVVAVDPDDDPLTYSWTVEDTPISDDPGNGDGTIDIDWSAIGVGNYTIACLISDSVNDPVPATSLDVLVGNQPPEVGPINGPTEVDAVDTTAVYDADATDPDIGQTLTFTWSLVPDGEPEEFIISGDILDGSLTVDYSVVDPGLYDINVRVSDGFADVDGIHVDVTHTNTPPVVGQVTGKTPVTLHDNDELYSAPYDDPDTTQTLVIEWSVVLSGFPPVFNIPSNPDGSLSVDWSTYSTGASYDINLRVNDGIDDTAGNDMTVIVNNAPPIIGEITGPTPVMRMDEVEDYNVTIDDIDGDPLIVDWSVVKAGDPADFSISGTVGSPLVYDWYPSPSLGEYEVNVRVDDSINPPVEGNPLIVSLVNSPPVPGAITGDTTSNCYYQPTYEVLSYSDADFDQTLTWYNSIMPELEPPDWQLLAGPSWYIQWMSWPIGWYEVRVKVDDGYVQVEGYTLMVERQNGPPYYFGVIEGPSTIIHGNIGQFLIDSIDCDPDQLLYHRWSVVLTGNPPEYDTYTGTDNTMDLDTTDLIPGLTYDIRSRISDGIDITDTGAKQVLIEM